MMWSKFSSNGYFCVATSCFKRSAVQEIQRVQKAGGVGATDLTIQCPVVDLLVVNVSHLPTQHESQQQRAVL